MARPRFSLGIFDYLPVSVRTILLINFIFFLLSLFGVTGVAVRLFLPLNYQAFCHGALWQPLTYFFFHTDFFHILFNMLAFYWMGKELEELWGTKSFTHFYLFCGIFSGLFILFWESVGLLGYAAWDWFGDFREIPNVGLDALGKAIAVQFSAAVAVPGDIDPLTAAGYGASTLGASGAVLGLLIAYCLYYPDRQILFFFVIPMRMATFIYISIVVSLFFMILPGLWPFKVQVSHAAHFGGIVAGFLAIRFFKSNPRFRPANNTLDSFFEGLKSRLGLKRRTAWSYEAPVKKPSFFTRLFAKKPAVVLDESRMNDREIEEKIDELLGVISRKGLKGLSIQEQLFLDRVATLYRHKFPD
jgi:membrane associated rhomboid family serine protease